MGLRMNRGTSPDFSFSFEIIFLHSCFALTTANQFSLHYYSLIMARARQCSDGDRVADFVHLWLPKIKGVSTAMGFNISTTEKFVRSYELIGISSGSIRCTRTFEFQVEVIMRYICANCPEKDLQTRGFHTIECAK